MRKILVIITSIFLIYLFSVMTVSACEFFINYEKIEAPLGVTGTIAVRVFKTHNDCTMKSMDEYNITGKNIQILRKSDWELIDNNLYEIKVQILLSNIGEGYFLIEKDCTKEGYESKQIPIIVNSGQQQWETALNKEYPYESNMKIHSLKGFIDIKDDMLFIDDEIFTIIDLPEVFLNYDKEIVVYYVINNEIKRPILLVGKDIYYRFD